MSARGELKASEVDVSFQDGSDSELASGHSIWIDDVEVEGTREELEQFIQAQIEELGGLTDPDHLCKQGVDGHGEVPEPRTMENIMDWAAYQVTGYDEKRQLHRSVWVCSRTECVLDAAAWAWRSGSVKQVVVRHTSGTYVGLDELIGGRG